MNGLARNVLFATLSWGACVACGTDRSTAGPAASVPSGGTAQGGSSDRGGAANLAGAGRAAFAGTAGLMEPARAGGSAGAGGTAGIGASNTQGPAPRGGSAGTAGAGAHAGMGELTAGAGDGRTTVVIFMVDGLMADAAKTAAAHGAANTRFVIDNGVSVQTAYSTSPTPRIELPDGTRPWGAATSGNVSVHTGTHLFEAPSAGMDDIFKATRAAGIKSVYAGGDQNYAIFKSATFNYGLRMEDEEVVQKAIEHLKTDGVRLLRLHLQRVRDHWKGPADRTNPASAYIQKVVAADALLGQLIQALEDAGVWDHTYLVLTSDHGMARAGSGTHPATNTDSWKPFLAFYGPDLKKGATIPYAELPDVAVTTLRFFGLPPLEGHLDGAVNISRPGATGTVLSHLFVGGPSEIEHPRPIERYLSLGTHESSGDAFDPYRKAMLGILQ